MRRWNRLYFDYALRSSKNVTAQTKMYNHYFYNAINTFEPRKRLTSKLIRLDRRPMSLKMGPWLINIHEERALTALKEFLEVTHTAEKHLVSPGENSH